MDGGNVAFQDHYSLPLPPIENFAYNEEVYIAEQGYIQSQHHYNYDYQTRGQSFNYRNIPDHVFQVQGQQYQSYIQQLEANQQQAMYGTYPAHAWGPYDVGTMLPHLTDMEQVEIANRGRHKRSRMSLQKRLLVNARERERMRVLNKAFEALRDALPCYIADGHMAKITTLRLAINYIKALTEVLEEQKEEDAEKERNVEDMSEGILSCEEILLLQKQSTDDEEKVMDSGGNEGCLNSKSSEDERNE